MKTTTSQKKMSSLTMDKAVFLLIRLKKAFRKKKEKGLSDKGTCNAYKGKSKPPLIRAKTLPAIVCPALNTVAILDSVNHSAQIAKGSPWKTEENVNAVSIATSSKASPTLSTSSSQINGTSSDKCKPSGSHDAWGKLARLLNQRDRASSGKVGQYRRRTYSLESKDGGLVRKASSIDCLVDQSCSSLSPGTGLTESKSIQLGPGGSTHLDAPVIDIPLSPSMPSKLGKNRSGWRRNSMELLTVDNASLTKSERKKLEKLNKINIHLQALFVAVEHQQVEKVRNILENTNVDVNGVNSDGLNPLDISVMTHNNSLVKLLQSYGAKENTNFPTKESKSSHLSSLVNEAEKKIEDLTSVILNIAGGGNISGTQIKEAEKQLNLWERRHSLFKRMKLGFDQSKVPESPSLVTLCVNSTNSIRVTYEEPKNQTVGIPTKYRIQWSQFEDFSVLEGDEEIYNLSKNEYIISGLEQGKRYYVRVSSGNGKGSSPFTIANPSSVVPSIWRDVDRRSPRSAGRLSMLDDLFNQIRNSRPEYASEIKAITDQLDTPAQQRKNQMRKSIKSLFTPAPKFHKHLKRGVFLASLLFYEGRVLVTTEECLPVVEVDESYSSSLQTDFHWLMKVACTWDDVKSLRQDMEKSLSSSTVYFRSKLLQAAAQMQSALGIQDLGQFFYRPIKDNNGTVVLCTVNNIKDVKTVNAISMKWISLSRIQRRIPLNNELPNAGELLLSCISEQIVYHRMSKIPLKKGLYLGFLKLKSSMDMIRVLVPEQTPNVLPHFLIRENSHVSYEEWEWLKSLAKGEAPSSPSPVQFQFTHQILAATRLLFQHLGIPEDEAVNHRIYDVEVVEFSPDVSFILMLPAVENVCSVPGQNDELSSRTDFMTLPVQIFEMVHMMTYQRDFISRYSRLSSILEIDTIMAQHALREAFSANEVTTARERLNQLQEFQQQVDNTWKGMRWIMDVLTWARDKQSSRGLLMSELYDWPLKDLPITKYTEDGEAYEDSRRSSVKSCNPHLLSNNNGSSGQLNSYSSSLKENKGSLLMVKENHFPNHSIPKSYSDTFAKTRKESGPMIDDSGSSVFDDSTSLTISLRSFSSNDIPTDDVKENITNSETSIINKKNVPEFSWIKIKDDKDKIGSSSNEKDYDIRKPVEPGILRVYAAYITGLAQGTSVKLHVTSKTTAREVIDLVVKELNLAIVMKGKNSPIYTTDQLPNFCLVAVLGARERCLRDDFRPLHLQNPWTKGRLYVRLKSDLLAAIQQHGIHHSAYL